MRIHRLDLKNFTLGWLGFILAEIAAFGSLAVSCYFWNENPIGNMIVDTIFCVVFAGIFVLVQYFAFVYEDTAPE